MLPLTVDPASTTAPFEQVRTQVAALVAQGDLAPGTRLPTVRQLAADLGLAANTVARAYRELEADGVVATYGRKGTFVRSAVVDAAPPDASAGRPGPRTGRGPPPRRTSRRCAALGLDVTEATRLVELAWARS